uniref:Uncharacterized protein n=1 Tax=Arundo donax TaxID=35708 RepID=A0A0A9DPB3_ARUDO
MVGDNTCGSRREGFRSSQQGRGAERTTTWSNRGCQGGGPRDGSPHGAPHPQGGAQGEGHPHGENHPPGCGQGGRSQDGGESKMDLDQWSAVAASHQVPQGECQDQLQAHPH